MVFTIKSSAYFMPSYWSNKNELISLSALVMLMFYRVVAPVCSSDNTLMTPKPIF